MLNDMTTRIIAAGVVGAILISWPIAYKLWLHRQPNRKFLETVMALRILPVGSMLIGILILAVLVTMAFKGRL